MARTRVPSARAALGSTRPQPAVTYADALARYEALRALDGDDINAVCHTELLTHERKTGRVTMLIHGLTNCPAQFSQFGSLFHQRGYNVFVPRMPRNGLADRNTHDLKRLTAGELRTWCDEVCDIAAGLGDEVTVLGLSGGGTLVAWMAQLRPDVHLAVPIAPLLGIAPNAGPLGRRASNMMTALLSVVPNIMTQNVSGRFKEGPDYGYYGFATRGLVAYMQLGAAVYASASKRPPAARRILMVLNDADPAVNTRYNFDLLHAWERQAAKSSQVVECFRFPASERLIHDVMDPHQRQQRIDYVYPLLVSLVTGEARSPGAQPA